MIRRILAALAIVLAASAAAAAQPQQRLALIIGNSKYQHINPLVTPANDARAMADVARRLGFTVTLVLDADWGTMNEAIAQFGTRLEKARLFLVYFAGQAVNASGRNYLVPVDAKLADSDWLEDENIELSKLVGSMDNPSRQGLVVLDASGEIRRPMAATLKSGLGIVDPGEFTAIVSSAQPGSLARDAGGPRGLFSMTLAKYLSNQSLDVKELYRRVRDEVRSTTLNEQTPWIDGSSASGAIKLAGPLPEPSAAGSGNFVSPVEISAVTGPSVAGRTPGGHVSTSSHDLARAFAWEAIKGTTDPGVLQSFIEQFPSSREATLGTMRLLEIEAEAARKAELERAQREREQAAKAPDFTVEDSVCALDPKCSNPGGRRVRGITALPARPSPAPASPPASPESRPSAAGPAVEQAKPVEPAETASQTFERLTRERAEAARKAELDTVARYPTIEADDRVAVGRATSVIVSLTVDQVTPEVKVGATGAGVSKTADGALALPMPPEATRMPIKVVLRAAGFELDPATPEEATIELDRTGDSTSAKFAIIARPDSVGMRWLRVTFWRDNEFLANVSRRIEILAAPSLANRPITELSANMKAAAPGPDQVQRQKAAHALGAQRSTPSATMRNPGIVEAGSAPYRLSGDSAIAIVLRPRPIDLKVEVVYDDPRQLGHGHITIASDYIGGLRHGEVNHSPDLVGWLDGFYREFRAPPAIEHVSGDPVADAAALREERLRRMRAFGGELYRRAAPPVLQQALAKLLADPKVTLRTIQIYSNNPLIPWELMRAPKPQGGSTDFFGIAFALARGQEDDEQITLRSPQEQRINEVVTIAPAYGASQSLASSSHEIEQIRALLASRQIAGRKSDFISLVRQPPAGIVHFAGHGEVEGQSAVERRFAILFEDGRFDVMDWRGLPNGNSTQRALYFFNACDVGQAESIAGLVEGWGPAVLARGATGYIGGLWPLRDEPASRFAIAFYQIIADDLRQNRPALVADALAKARRLVYDTGDPTYLAYAFYGDAQLEFVQAR